MFQSIKAMISGVGEDLSSTTPGSFKLRHITLQIKYHTIFGLSKSRRPGEILISIFWIFLIPSICYLFLNIHQQTISIIETTW